MLLTKLRTVQSLGLCNLVRVLWYRLSVRSGLNPVRRLKGDNPQGIFFTQPKALVTGLKAPMAWQTQAKLFSYWLYQVSDAPLDWHANPLTGARVNQPDRDWWRIPDFDPGVGDIKLIWELSRFDWVLAFAQQALSGDSAVSERLNIWLNDWCQHNPPYRGPNWKCGQEASIRVMHLAIAALLLDQIQTPAKALTDLIALHLQRIEPTLSYAVAQDNNHGTSEAAALFIGGSWLDQQGHLKGAHWSALGRKWLENRASRLIEKDGSFSQYSLNYHRVMLDTFSMVEVWRRHLRLEAFSSHWQQRAKAAAHWLHTMINPWDGDGPNVGANDGARLLQLTDADYRDFRPSVQLASVLFANAKAYSASGVWDQPLSWLGLDLPTDALSEPVSEVFDQGGFVVLRDNEAMVMLRYPRFRFRPSQADALHVDLWLKDRNLLRDSGTYSYNTEACWLRYFPGTESHNTIQFDDRDQMPRLSRFLFGDWLKTRIFKPLSQSDSGQEVTVGYRDGSGGSHIRKLCMSPEGLRVIDEIDGFNHKAVLRWHLQPGDWVLDGNLITLGKHQVRVEGSVPLVRCELVQGWESRYYHDKQRLPVLEIEVNQPGRLITEYRWNP